MIFSEFTLLPLEVEQGCVILFSLTCYNLTIESVTLKPLMSPACIITNSLLWESGVLSSDPTGEETQSLCHDG